MFVPVWGLRSSDSGYWVTLHAWIVQEAQTGPSAGRPQTQRLSVDFWTLKQGRKNWPSPPVNGCYKPFVVHEGCFQRQQLSTAAQTHGLLHWSAFLGANLHVQTWKGLKRTFDTSFFFVNHREHIFYGRWKRSHFSSLCLRDERVRSSSVTKTAVFYRLAKELLSFVK